MGGSTCRPANYFITEVWLWKEMFVKDGCSKSNEVQIFLFISRSTVSVQLQTAKDQTDSYSYQSRIRALSQTVLCIRVFLFLSLKYKWWQTSKISSSTKPTITEKGQLELLSFYLQNYAGLQNNSLKHER